MELKAIKCLLTATYQSYIEAFLVRLVVFMIAPAVALIGVFLLMFAQIYWRTRPGSAAKPKWDPEDRLVVVQNRRTLTQERGSSDWRKVLARARNSAFATALDATVLVLPQTISAMAQVQDCAATADGGYLLQNPQVSCYDPSFLAYKNSALAIGYVWISIPFVLCVLIFSGASERIVNVFKSRWSPNVTSNLLNRISRSALGGNDGAARRVHLTKFRKLSARDRQRFSWAFAVVLRENLLMGIATGFVYFTVSDSQVLASLLLILAFLCAHISIGPYKWGAVNLLDGVAYMSELLMLVAVQRHINSSRNPNDVVSEQRVYDYIALGGFAAFMLLLVLLVVDSAVFEGANYQTFENSVLVASFAERLRKEFSKLLGTAHRSSACSCRRAAAAAAAPTASAKDAKAPPAIDGRRGRAGGDGRVAIIGAALRKHRNTFIVENPMQMMQIAEASRIFSVIHSQASAGKAVAQLEKEAERAASFEVSAATAQASAASAERRAEAAAKERLKAEQLLAKRAADAEEVAREKAQELAEKDGKIKELEKEHARSKEELAEGERLRARLGGGFGDSRGFSGGNGGGGGGGGGSGGGGSGGAGGGSVAPSPVNLSSFPPAPVFPSPAASAAAAAAAAATAAAAARTRQMAVIELKLARMHENRERLEREARAAQLVADEIASERRLAAWAEANRLRTEGRPQ
jgi:uncharacterized membrane protein YgcG